MAQTNKFEKQFFNALHEIFVGAKVEGDSGYVNLMGIKSRYYERGVFPQLQKDITAALKPFPDFREELFDKLYTFFQRYFSESGSIYFRYTALHQNVYEKVYTDDRDVILFWKTHMLYYVKTDRIFTSLNVEVDGVNFFFDASKMTLKKSNEKREVIYAFRKVHPEDGTLVFDVAYSEKGRTTKVDDILKDLKKAGVKLSDETLYKAFRVFEKQSEVDYFINKNARAFLQEQFDLWLYQYLFAGQNVWGAERLAQLQALKTVAYQVIDFISQFEDELVKIWNKPKFVRNSHYVLTLDHIIANAVGAKQSPAEGDKIASGEERPRNDNLSVIATPAPSVIASPAPSVIASPAGAKQSPAEGDKIASGTERPRNDILARLLTHPNLPQQVQEWRDLGMIGEDFKLEMLTQKDADGAPLHPQYQYLPMDTKYFPDLELDILALFDDLDAALDGWLVHSENYQALITLLPKFKQRVDAVYIDPPYNTDASAIIYSNDYKDSSWATLMENRLNVVSNYLKQEGIICVAIDDEEIIQTKFILSTIFKKQVGIAAVRSNPAGRKTKGKFAPAHEYALFYGISEYSIPSSLEKTEHALSRFPKEDDSGRYSWANFIRSGSHDKRIDRPKLYYPIFVDKNDNIRVPRIEWVESKREYELLEEPDENEVVVYPDVLKEGRIIQKNWHRGYIRMIKELPLGEYRVRRDKSNNISIDFKTRMDEESLPITWWDHKKYASANYGAAELKELFGQSGFDFPKSKELVSDCLQTSGISEEYSIAFDFFAGSGTTAHAVMNLNRADGGKRKYILVEMGEHFHTVILPRIKKVAFSDKWKDGKANGGQGMSHFVKYYDLEQYEDVLRRAHYADADLFNNPYEDPYHSYVFLRDLKMLDSVEMDVEQNKAHFYPERLYSDIDLAETLSQRRGKWIKRITAEYVEFQDGERMSLTDPDWQTIKPLVWWQ
ncbi:site-specific DNA-methyltransferase [Levilinea saccharolytica]|uniref:Adenine specific DNA methylase Mod n=1 Tax=Levilinea saccharolytica TaxID=229921 RepID=A0A0M8JQR3_9CHLR|nr:site-specific DNA-methyltransferase [Levilinea saccharolytica]KPL82220.1 hypothetical protein ADN01_08915 [Levilinea saccharolytica]GAP19468.1 adenine specific DNA methylase Mod [Levilinea saccharolytica]